MQSVCIHHVGLKTRSSNWNDEKRFCLLLIEPVYDSTEAKHSDIFAVSHTITVSPVLDVLFISPNKTRVAQ